MLPVRRVVPPLLALAYALSSPCIAIWVAAIGEFHCYNSECLESGSDWTQVRDAWQWEAMVWLGLLSGLAGLVTLALVASTRRPLFQVIGLGFHAAMLVPALGLLLESNEFSPVQSVFWLGLVLGSGGALIYLRNSRQIEGTRRE